MIENKHVAVTLISILAFCKKHDIPETRFGREAVNDPRLISDLRRGTVLTSKRIEKIRNHMIEKEKFLSEIK